MAEQEVKKDDEQLDIAQDEEGHDEVRCLAVPRSRTTFSLVMPQTR
jgi:hypothetical protein